MSEQQSETGTTTVTATTGDRWGDAITPARQAQLDGYFQRWDSLSAGEQAERGSPFAGVSLSGADVFSLAARTLAGPDGDQAAWDAAVAQLRAAQNDLGLQLMLHLADLHLEGAVLGEARLEDAFLDAAHLERAKLVGASFDKTSRLNDAVLTGASFDQVTFDNTNLTVVDWSLVDRLGDERTARTRTDADGKSKDRGMRLAEFKAAVRANRVLAVTLQAQGLSEDASRFAYRAQLLQRQVLRRQRKLAAYLGSLLLDTLAGYGYRPSRIFQAYVAVVLSFAAAYWAVSHFLETKLAKLSWDEALVLSLTSFHGRGFFPGFLASGDWVARLGAAEAVIGLFIELVLIATFSRRFLGN